jgi:hypothetical protein
MSSFTQRVLRAADHHPEESASPDQSPVDSPADVPKPTAQFRRRAWLEFQRALDPLARPKASLAMPTNRARGGLADAAD